MNDSGSEWDQLSIETPELVAIEMPLAGIGSRFIALLVELGFRRGTPGPNQYGPDPLANRP